MISFKRMLLMIYLVVCILFKVIKTAKYEKKENNVKNCVEQIEVDLGRISAENLKSYISNIILSIEETDVESYFGYNYLTEIKVYVKPASSMKLPGKYCGETFKNEEKKLVKQCEQEIIRSYEYLDTESPDIVFKDALLEKKKIQIRQSYVVKYLEHVSQNFVIDDKLLFVDKYCEREMENKIQECIMDINQDIGALSTSDDQQRIIWKINKDLLKSFNARFYFSEVRDNLVPSPEMSMPDKFCEVTCLTEKQACSEELKVAEFVGESTYDMINRAFYEIVGNNYKEKHFVCLYLEHINSNLTIKKDLDDRNKFCRTLILLQLDIPTEKVEFVLKRSDIHQNYKEEVTENDK